jgi:hypothetical protein
MKKIYKISITSILVVGVGLLSLHYLNSSADDRSLMDISECHQTTKSDIEYFECNLSAPFTWSITQDTLRNNNQFNSWTDYDTVGATTVQTLDPSNLTALNIKAIVFNKEGYGYFQLDDNSWVSLENFKEIPGINPGKLEPTTEDENMTKSYLKNLSKVSSR